MKNFLSRSFTLAIAFTAMLSILFAFPAAATDAGATVIVSVDGALTKEKATVDVRSTTLRANQVGASSLIYLPNKLYLNQGFTQSNGDFNSGVTFGNQKEYYYGGQHERESTVVYADVGKVFGAVDYVNGSGGDVVLGVSMYKEWWTNASDNGARSSGNTGDVAAMFSTTVGIGNGTTTGLLLRASDDLAGIKLTVGKMLTDVIRVGGQYSYSTHLGGPVDSNVSVFGVSLGAVF